MRIHFLGGADEIGASCLAVEMDGARVLVDCGVRFHGSSTERLPRFELLDEVDGASGPPDAILITHAHLDHIGALPVAARRFPRAAIRATEPTIALLRIQLLDALRIMELGARSEEELPLYSLSEVESLLERLEPVPLRRPIDLVPGGAKATFFPAGHILGAASIGLEGPSGRILITGDVSAQNQRTIPGQGAPRFQPDLLVCESTYGSRPHPDRAAEEERLAEMVKETIASGGKVLVPAFAIGRAQEVILSLIQAMLTRRLPRIPIHVDGMVRSVCQVYRSFPAWLQPRLKRRVERFGDPFFDVLENVRPVQGEKRRAEILEGPPCVIVASSGMLTGGASPVYARVLAQGAEHRIAIAGYQDEESPGRQLLDAAEGRSDRLLLDGREVLVRCRVDKLSLSAHSDGPAIARLVRELAPGDTILVHGGAGAREELAALLEREVAGRVHLPRAGDQAILRGAKGATSLEIIPGAPLEAPAALAASPPPPSPVKLQNPPPRAARAPSPPPREALEQAIARVEAAFEGGQPRLLRARLHAGKKEAYLRLTFFTPQAGEGARERIATLERETGWPIRIDPEPERKALAAEARRLLEPLGKIRRGPRIQEKRRAVEVEVALAAGGASPGKNLGDLYRARTGWELRASFR